MMKRHRNFAALALMLAAACPALGQEPGVPMPVTTVVLDGNGEQPPLLVPPEPPTPPPPGVQPQPSPPGFEYDPGYLYLPETNPQGRGAQAVCGPPGRWWVIPTLELGWTKPQHEPATVYSGIPLPNGQFALGPIVYGNQSLPTPFRAGLGVALGMWFDPSQTRGVDASFYWLSEGTTGYTLFSPGTSPLFEPVINPATGQTAFFPLASPQVGNGAFQAFSETKYITADVNYRRMLICGDSVWLDALFGFRYAHLSEGLHLYNKQIDAADSLIRTKDHISDVNNFYGGQFGLAGEKRFGRWYVSGTGKLAFGPVVTTSNMEGAFRVNGVVDPYGFYTRPAVSGQRSHTDFAVMPIVNLNVGRQIGDHARVFVGYTFQFLSSVTRPADVLDPVPEFNGSGNGMTRDASLSSFWVQSVTMGMEWRY